MSTDLSNVLREALDKGIPLERIKEVWDGLPIYGGKKDNDYSGDNSDYLITRKAGSQKR